MSKLRGYQRDIQHQVMQNWQSGNRVVMPVCATGSGKTVIMADTAKYNTGHGIAAAHRSELVGQISLALAKEGMQHNIMAPKAVIKTVCEQHMDELGKQFFNPRAKWHVAGIDTLIRRDISAWAGLVTMAFMDEGHHVLADNKWGKGVALFPNANWMLPTATPDRADGRGLGAHASGLVDAMVLGPPMQWLIDEGYLTPFQIRAPLPSDLDMAGVEVSRVTGDYNAEQVRAAVKRSNKIVGDVVKTYLRHTPGMLGIVFAVDVEHATTITEEFNRNGVPAAVITADNTTEERRRILRDFRDRKLMVLVNVDLFGEGFDLPAIEVVMFARPTASYALYAQQFGRALRLMISRILMEAWDIYDAATRRKLIAESIKPIAHIHDHVGNVLHFRGPPTRPREWSLDDASRRGRAPDGIPMRVCVNEVCLQPYERTEKQCPYCNTVPPPPKAPNGPEEVDGDITLYTPEMFDQLFGEIQRIDGPCYAPQNVAPYVKQAIANKHHARQEAQKALREILRFKTMAPGLEPQKAMRQFFHTYGIDVMTAQTLGTSEAESLRQRIVDSMNETAVK